MTRKSKRRSKFTKGAKTIQNWGLGGDNSCDSFVKGGRSHCQDAGDFNNCSENDVVEYNLKHSNNLIYQKHDSDYSSDEDIVLYQGRRLSHDYPEAVLDGQKNVDHNHSSELLAPTPKKHFSSDYCYHVFTETDAISEQNPLEPDDSVNDEDTAFDDYIENLREFDEPALSKVLYVHKNMEIVPEPEVVDNQVRNYVDEKLISRTSPSNYENDFGSIPNDKYIRNVGYTNQNASMHGFSKENIFSHENVPDSNNKQHYSDNDRNGFAEELRDQHLSPIKISPGKYSNKQGRRRRNESVTEDWLLGNLRNTTENLRSDREELNDNDDISLSVELDYIDRKLGEMDIVDPDLEASLYSQWRLDRSKKAQKKKEREQLRVMGLLGRKQKTKYKKSSIFTKRDLKREIQVFLSSNEESKSFPPLGRAERKFVHQLAHAFGLKSRSIGQGISRHPIIYKTATSMRYFGGEAEPNSRGLQRVRPSFTPRERIKGENDKNYRRRGGPDRFAVGYREGEIVGAAAPELAAENVGNQLMRKLGWKPGEALGAQNNKGILQPVAHVVKNTRSGLG